MEKKKISAFEFAIIEVADPEKAKECEPLTTEEEEKIRYNKLMSMAKRMKIKGNAELKECDHHYAPVDPYGQNGQFVCVSCRKKL